MGPPFQHSALVHAVGGLSNILADSRPWRGAFGPMTRRRPQPRPAGCWRPPPLSATGILRAVVAPVYELSLIHISEPTRLALI
eukprot:4127673-Alexandrium_andersonii.AAC.1